MLERAKEIINDIKEQTDTIVLMHSLSGKDSICLLDLCYPHFKRIVCCFMYTVPNLRHIAEYYVWAKRKYPNIEIVQVPHYTLLYYRKYGFLGKAGNDKQRLWQFSDIVKKVCEAKGIEWACVGFKQSDSLNRRLMLRSYKDGKMAINYSTKRFYPLSTYKNKDVLEYIKMNNLKNPETYEDIGQSCGVDVTSYGMLKYLSEHYPDDLEKVYREYPAARLVIPNEEHRLKLKGK